ncbi:uncharacterized protein LACBIDRAFT_300243 [Laccaria bicolor S238N-H82]|uniref:Predicted protein n=1 Tax=Laccaria bicolor (strain S238N-H82 / ATCC MYA-4686) TaxID=486041 RepID=B0E3W5_LACBS|nr:uncharacterized protein LACBIDRAFT_300243 [Laccaria bicolor S238N-H82]EDQ98466.1 predicted protein [Laccaria bicolor S238N-H82]|eukprot:XP_001890883.1 predicted protein [Laccaria bicolor S238N-H82]
MMMLLFGSPHLHLSTPQLYRQLAVTTIIQPKKLQWCTDASLCFHHSILRVSHNRLDLRGKARAAGNQDHPCDPHRLSSAAVDPCPPTGYELQLDLVRMIVGRGMRRNVRNTKDG